MNAIAFANNKIFKLLYLSENSETWFQNFSTPSHKFVLFTKLTDLHTIINTNIASNACNPETTGDNTKKILIQAVTTRDLNTQMKNLYLYTSVPTSHTSNIYHRRPPQNFLYINIISNI